jgi:hypothetical protein
VPPHGANDDRPGPGTAHGRFTRAIRNSNLLNAEIAAREIGELSLADALSFCLLLADVDPPCARREFDWAVIAFSSSAAWVRRFVGRSSPPAGAEVWFVDADVSTTANIYVQGSPADLQTKLDKVWGE